MAYIGSSAAVTPVAFSGVNAQSFNGDGSTVAFTLNRPVSSVAAIEVVVNNVQQSPYDGSYSVSNTTLTFSAAPSTGTGNIYVVYRDFPVGSITDPNTYTKTQTDTLLAGRVAKTGDTMTGDLRVDAKLNVNTSSYAQQLAVRQDDANGLYRGVKVLNWAGNNAVSGVYFQGYDWVQGGIWHGRGVTTGTNRSGALVLGTNPDTNNLTEEGLVGRLIIDNAGRVTMPYQPVFSARLSSNQTVNSGIAILQFASTDINQGSHFNTSTYRFTAPVAGKYYLNLRQYCNPASGTYMGVYITGTPGTRYGFSPVGNDTSVDVTWIVYLAAGDYVEGYYYNSGTMTARPDGTAFEGFLIG